ncbi:hypothetical protein HRbin05_00074 [archaeon HR05]|nr:hypothetical protein HRbin05_00074 [archaeon HR05]
MVEVLWFEDIEPLKQPVFDFPLLGRISMKQMGIVGSASIIALASRDILIAMASLTIALFVAMTRYRAVSMDEFIYSLILYGMKHKVKPSIEIIFRYVNELLLNNGYSRIILARMVNKICNEIRCRLDKKYAYSSNGRGVRCYEDNIIILNSNTVRLRLRLLTKDGRAIANRLARIYVDDDLLTNITSDNNGELDVILSLTSTKNSNLRVYVDGYSKPLLEKVVTVISA